MPVRNDTYKGLGLPTLGSVNLKGDNSTGDVLTVTQSTGGGGNLLVLRTAPTSGVAGALDSTVGTADQVRVTSAGVIQILDATTVVLSLSTAGLQIGGNTVISSVGGLAGGAQIVTINTSASTLVSSNSGKMHVLSTQAASSNFIYLPTAANARQGDVWDLISETTAVSLWNLSILGTSGQIFAHVGSTAVVVTTGALDTTATTGAMWWKVVCLSTLLPSYMASNMLTPSGLPTTGAMFSFGAGTTA